MVGFRTPSGVITTTQTFKTIEIPRQVRGKPGAWNPSVCLEWGDRFLKSIRELVLGAGTDAENASRNVWRASFVPGTGVRVRTLDQSEVDEVVNMEDRIGFLPRWYWSEMVQAQAAQPDAVPGGPAASPGVSVAAAGSHYKPAAASAPPPASLSGWQI